MKCLVWFVCIIMNVGYFYLLAFRFVGAFNIKKCVFKHFLPSLIGLALKNGLRMTVLR